MAVDGYLLSILLLCSTAAARKVVVLDDNEWDSVVVTSSPVQITKRVNRTNPAKNPASENSISRMMKECQAGDLKCFYDLKLNESHGKNPKETVDEFLERFSSVTNVKINEDLRNATSKSYWNQINAESHKHPYDDVKGWVTMDPLPWSSSKVSKWKPGTNAQSTPWGYGPSQQGPPPAHQWLTKPEGARPTVHWNVGSNDIITDDKPNDFPLSSNPYPPPSHPSYASSNSGFPPSVSIFSSSQGISHSRPVYTSTHNQNPPVFTTMQAGPFPAISQGYSPPQYAAPKPYPENTNYVPVSHTQRPLPWQSNYNFPPSNINHHEVSLNTPAAPWYQTSTGHPPSYPDEGNGEWVLLSTTKGYSLPPRYQERKAMLQQISDTNERPQIVSRSMTPKYEENDLDENYMLVSKSSNENRKSDRFEQDEPAGTVWNVDGINILHTGGHEHREERKHFPANDMEPKVNRHQQLPPETTFKRTVRLTVLPPLPNSTTTMTTSHGGMLEVDSNPQTVEESQREEEQLKKIRRIAIVTGGGSPVRLVSASTNNQKSRSYNLSNKKKAAVLAAVGAGMIPATVAMLLPVALGRKRRSVNESSQILPTDFIR